MRGKSRGYHDHLRLCWDGGCGENPECEQRVLQERSVGNRFGLRVDSRHRDLCPILLLCCANVMCLGSFFIEKYTYS